MLIIKESQFMEMGRSSLDSFMKRMEDSISENFNLDKNDQTFKIHLKLFVEEALHFGIDTEDLIEQYLFLKWKYSIFKINPLAKELTEILSYPDRDAELKIDELIYFLAKSKLQ